MESLGFWVIENYKWARTLGPAWVVDGFLTLAIHEIIYFGAYIPFFIAEFIPSLRKYKIQQTVTITPEQRWNCLKRVLFLHFLIEGPWVFLTHPLATLRGMSTDVDTIPSLGSMLAKIVLFFLFEDFWFYWVHRALHHPSIYKYVHKVHHDHAAPFGMVGEYAHPIETFILGFGTVMPAMLWADHLFTLWLWTALRVVQVIECHSGYNFPWSMNNWLPGWGGAEFHDYHHMTFSGNYASTFIWWDAVFGTDNHYRSWKLKLQGKKEAERDLIDKTSDAIHWILKAGGETAPVSTKAKSN